MTRNPDVPLNPERSEESRDDVKTRAVPQSCSATMIQCHYVNERKCSTSEDEREGDQAYAVTAVMFSDQHEFRKKVETNLEPLRTFGQQCAAVSEGEEQRDVIVKTFSSEEPSCSSMSELLMSSRSSPLVTPSSASMLSRSSFSSEVSSCSSNVESSKSS